MQIDKEWLGAWFDRFNHDYFGSRLPRPRLSVGRSRTRLGTMSFKRRSSLWHARRTDYSIRVSNYYDMSERQFQNVLLHEMIHYSIAYEGLKDTSPHGQLFRSRMQALNDKYGWEITVMTSVRGMSVAAGMATKRRYLVLALVLNTGDRLLTVVNPRYASRLERSLLMAFGVQSHAWYTSQDNYFSLFPRVRTLRGRRVPTSLYKQKIREMTPFRSSRGSIKTVGSIDVADEE